MAKWIDISLNYEDTANKNFTFNNFVFEGESNNKYFIFILNQYNDYIVELDKLIDTPKIISIPSKYDSKNVTMINNFGFSNIANLEILCVPSIISSIGSYAFNNCPNLKVIYLDGTTVKNIGENTFENTFKDLVIYVPEDIYSQYMSSPQWSPYNNKIHPVSNLTDIVNSAVEINKALVNVLSVTAINSSNISVIFNSYYLKFE